MKTEIKRAAFERDVLPTLQQRFEKAADLEKAIADGYEITDAEGREIEYQIKASNAPDMSKAIQAAVAEAIKLLPRPSNNTYFEASMNIDNSNDNDKLPGSFITKGAARRVGSWALAAFANSTKAHGWCDAMGIPITKAASESSNTAGGVLVPEIVSSDIIQLMEKYGVFRKFCRVRRMTSDTLVVPRRTGGLSASWTAEGAAGSESTKSWDSVSLNAKKLMILSRFSSELNEDAVIDVGADLAMEIALAFATSEDQAGFIGDGSVTYGGITGVATALTTKWTDTANDSAGVVIAAGNTFAEVVHQDLVDVVARLPEYAAMGDPAWYCSRMVWASVFGRLTTQASTGMGTRKEDIAGNLPQTYLGYPIRVAQAMPKADVNSQIITFFGDLGMAASMGDRRQVTITVSNSGTVGGEDVFARDQLAIRGTERVDINVHDVGDGTTAGPIIGLRASAS